MDFSTKNESVVIRIIQGQDVHVRDLGEHTEICTLVHLNLGSSPFSLSQMNRLWTDYEQYPFLVLIDYEHTILNIFWVFHTYWNIWYHQIFVFEANTHPLRTCWNLASCQVAFHKVLEVRRSWSPGNSRFWRPCWRPWKWYPATKIW